MPLKRHVYILDPKNLSPETIAVTFAKTSRSPQRFIDIATELSDEKSSEFHEKWVVGYGHASVAEHAILHVAVENISRLAVETLESCRLASYTEKSTRYQKWSPEEFYFPAELKEPDLQAVYNKTISSLFQSYHEALPIVKTWIEQQYPRTNGESDAAWERRIRSDYVDVCRYYLPSASLANVGMTINARALEHTLSKMLSHPLDEVRQIGEELKTVSQAVIPTLVKYANPNHYLQSNRSSLQQIGKEITDLPKGSSDFCRLVSYDAEIEHRILAAALYRCTSLSFEQALAFIHQSDLKERKRIAATIFNDLSPFDIPIRELEYGNLVFDITIDQGGYFELKRHRMMTQTPQALTTQLGYAIPRGISEAGLQSHFEEAMQQADQAYQKIAAHNPEVAAYVVPNAYNRHVLLQLNLRSADHFLALRSAQNAHFALRRLTQCMASQIRNALPLLGEYLRVNHEETWQGIESAFFTRP